MKWQILRYWMRRYGELSPASRDRFLKRRELTRLARYPDEIVKQALRFSNMLDDALSFAHSAYEGSPRPLPQDVTAALRRRIGATQHYDDDF
jgi:hypothetical protein